MAQQYNLAIDQGTDYQVDLTLRDENGDLFDLTGASAEAQIRKHYASNSAVEFTTSVTEETGVISLSLTAAQTAAMTPGRYVYDVLLTTNEDKIERVVEGICTVMAGVTR